MSAAEIGQKLVQLCNEGRAEDAVREFYDNNVVSIEAQEMPEMPARMEGLEAIAQKNAWWFDNHEVHAMNAQGPFVGLREDQFAVRFDLDVTPKGGERMQMSEVAIYTIANGKIVQEEFLYQI